MVKPGRADELNIVILAKRNNQTDTNKQMKTQGRASSTWGMSTTDRFLQLSAIPFKVGSQYISFNFAFIKTHHYHTNILDDSFWALCIDYWNTGRTVIKGENKTQDTATSDTVVFPLVPEAGWSCWTVVVMCAQLVRLQIHSHIWCNQKPESLQVKSCSIAGVSLSKALKWTFFCNVWSLWEKAISNIN